MGGRGSRRSRADEAQRVRLSAIAITVAWAALGGPGSAAPSAVASPASWVLPFPGTRSAAVAPDGSLIVACPNGTKTALAHLTNEGVVDRSFGADGQADADVAAYGAPLVDGSGRMVLVEPGGNVAFACNSSPRRAPRIRLREWWDRVDPRQRQRQQRGARQRVDGLYLSASDPGLPDSPPSRNRLRTRLTVSARASVRRRLTMICLDDRSVFGKSSKGLLCFYIPPHS